MRRNIFFFFVKFYSLGTNKIMGRTEIIPTGYLVNEI